LSAPGFAFFFGNLVLLKIVSRSLAALAILIALVAATVYLRSNARLHRLYHVVVPRPDVPTDAAAVEMGHHLAISRGCLSCHGQDLAGAVVIDDPAMGRISGPNLTRGRGGLPRFSDEDFVRAIRHGVAADGHGLFLMPSADYSRMTENDVVDLIAYVKSVPPVDRESPPLRVGPVSRALLVAGKFTLAADIIDHDHLKPDVVEPGPTVAYGRYLAVTCTGCHGENYSGGKIAIGPPSWPPAANLTPHPSGRLAQWTEADFVRALRTKRRPDGTELNAVMPSAFGQFTDIELEALWSFLKTLPPAPTGTR
jgi:mono/diheme cytochrome c family protein